MSPSPSRSRLAVGAAAAALLLVGGVAFVRGWSGGEAPERRADAKGDMAKPHRAEGARRPSIRTRRSEAARRDGEEGSGPSSWRRGLGKGSSPHVPTQLEPTRDEALTEFEASMKELEMVAVSGLKLGPERSAEVYGRVTGAFEILSQHVDVGDPEQADALEAAYRDMKARLKRARVQPPARPLTAPRR